MNNNYIGKDTKKINIDNLLMDNVSSLDEPKCEDSAEQNFHARTKEREMVRRKRNQRKRINRYIKKQVVTVLVGVLIILMREKNLRYLAIWIL